MTSASLLFAMPLSPFGPREAGLASGSAGQTSQQLGRWVRECLDLELEACCAWWALLEPGPRVPRPAASPRRRLAGQPTFPVPQGFCLQVPPAREESALALWAASRFCAATAVDRHGGEMPRRGRGRILLHLPPVRAPGPEDRATAFGMGDFSLCFCVHWSSGDLWSHGHTHLLAIVGAFGWWHIHLDVTTSLGPQAEVRPVRPFCPVSRGQSGAIEHGCVPRTGLGQREVWGHSMGLGSPSHLCPTGLCVGHRLVAARC